MAVRQAGRIAAVVLAALLGMRSATADEAVTFASARYLVGELAQRLAQERGEPPPRAAADTIGGSLSRPSGNGPFPAVVHLHGCEGPGAGSRNSADQFTRWGYVVLMVDSFTARGIKDDCLGRHILARTADGFGALAYLATLPFVDAGRVAVVGHGQGGDTALQLASDQPAAIFDIPDTLKFRAAVAYYPVCGAAGDRLSVPALILIGELDDWSPAASCARLLRRFDAGGAPLKITVFPGAIHGFDDPDARGGTRAFGHAMRYDEAAAGRAAAETRDFLAARLTRQRSP